MSGYRLPFCAAPFQAEEPPLRLLSDEERNSFKASISDLKQKRVVQECEDCSGQFLSSIFLVPKPDGSSRLILNLKVLNTFLSVPHFRLEDGRSVAKLMSPGVFMASLDLKDAYYLVPIHLAHRKFLRFRFDGILYEFLSLPFGLTSAPFVFTKLLKPVMSFLRLQGFVSVIYLDDVLLFGSSISSCSANIRSTIELFESLGFIINYAKSNLSPSRSCKYLGFIYDSTSMSIRLPSEKIGKILSLIRSLSVGRQISIRDFARLLGYLVSCCPAVRYGFAHTKIGERAKFLALDANFGDFDRKMIISSEVMEDLSWWQNVEFFADNPIRCRSFVLEIFSDASLSGWGACCNGQRAGGPWMQEESSFHINYLELLAAFFGLRCFASELSDCQILLRIDNTTAVTYINRMGGTHSVRLNDITQKIWQWCSVRNLWVFASYIASADNSVADFESRRGADSGDISVSPEFFRSIVLRFGLPEIDLFASRDSAKCRRYVSWKPDPGSWAIDAFSLCWSGTFFYAFPPVSVIAKVLQKIRSDGGRGIVLVPRWPAQPWYPVFRQLLESEPWSFRANEGLIFSSSEQSTFWDKVTLEVGLLSGRL